MTLKFSRMGTCPTCRQDLNTSDPILEEEAEEEWTILEELEEEEEEEWTILEELEEGMMRVEEVEEGIMGVEELEDGGR